MIPSVFQRNRVRILLRSGRTCLRTEQSIPMLIAVSKLGIYNKKFPCVKGAGAVRGRGIVIQQLTISVLAEHRHL